MQNDKIHSCLSCLKKMWNVWRSKLMSSKNLHQVCLWTTELPEGPGSWFHQLTGLMKNQLINKYSLYETWKEYTGHVLSKLPIVSSDTAWWIIWSAQCKKLIVQRNEFRPGFIAFLVSNFGWVKNTLTVWADSRNKKGGWLQTVSLSVLSDVLFRLGLGGILFWGHTGKSCKEETCVFCAAGIHCTGFHIVCMWQYGAHRTHAGQIREPSRSLTSGV